MSDREVQCEFFAFVKPDSDFKSGWTGDGWSNVMKQWLRFDDVDELGEYQITLSSLDIDYMPARVTAYVQQIDEGPEAGTWGYGVLINEIELVLADEA